jgi:uncharacterized OB-fold protein
MPSPRYRREMPQRYRLEAAQCKKCNTIAFPPRLVCAKCGSKDFEKTTLSEYGKIITFTTIRVAPANFETQVPYNVAVVETDNGARVLAQVADCNAEDLKIGQRVKFVFRKLSEEGHTGILCYGYKVILTK